MEIPYTVRPRPDTGLANPKLGVWLFLASEVMLFGGLFAGYIFMRLGAEPWMWPTGWLNVPVGTMNTFVLIASSVTVILAWESLKMGNYKGYKGWLAATWICGLIFLVVKLSYEWPDKFHHFGAYLKPEAVAKYEPYLGNEDSLDEKGYAKTSADGHKMIGRKSRLLAERRFISGHLDEKDPYAMASANAPYVKADQLDAIINYGKSEPADSPKKSKQLANRKKFLEMLSVRPADIETLLTEPLDPVKKEEILHHMNTIHVHALDMANAKPFDPANDHARFWPAGQDHSAHVELNKADLIAGHGAFVPKLNTYLACYFMITGLHGAHVLGGCIVFIYFWLNIKGGAKLFYTNRQQLANRIEVAGLFWHLVDLIWIFVFPIFYLL